MAWISGPTTHGMFGPPQWIMDHSVGPTIKISYPPWMLPESNYEEARPNIKGYTTLESWALQSRKLSEGPKWAEFFVVRNRKSTVVVAGTLLEESMVDNLLL